MPKISALNLDSFKDDPHRFKAWLIVGNEGLLQQRAYDTLLNWFLSAEERDFNQATLHASEISVAEILAQASTLPFLASRRIVTVREAERLTAAEQKQIADRLKSLPDTTRLILIKSLSDTRPAKEPRGKASLDAQVAEWGMVIDCVAPTKDALRSWIAAEVKRQGKKIEPVAAGMLSELIGGDLARLSLEIEKIALYMDDAPTITKPLVQKLVHKTAEETIFRLTDAVAEKKVAVALRVLEELMSEAEGAHAILGMLTRQFRLLTQAHWLVELGYLPGPVEAIPEDVAAKLSKTHNIMPTLKNQSWVAGKLIQQAKAFSQADLTRAFNRLLQADLSLKGIEDVKRRSILHDPKLTMQMLVVDLCAARR